jgi:hypothetical protein
MSRSDAFLSQPVENKMPANLRYRAREAAEYLTGLKHTEVDDSHVITRQKYGRGARGESSN